MTTVEEPITVTDSETGEVFIACPDKHGNTIIDCGDCLAVHIGDGIYRMCKP